MAITKESKQALKLEVSKLEEARNQVNKQIDEIDVQKAKLVSRRQDINAAITNLKADIDNG